MKPLADSGDDHRFRPTQWDCLVGCNEGELVMTYRGGLVGLLVVGVASVGGACGSGAHAPYDAGAGGAGGIGVGTGGAGGDATGGTGGATGGTGGGATGGTGGGATGG